MNNTTTQGGSWTALKVLVTGGNGFLGRHLCQRLCNAGCEVHATSRQQRRSNASSGPTWWQVDVADFEEARRLFAEVRPNIVVHLAGSVGASPDLGLVLPTYHSLLTGAVNVLMAASDFGRRVILSGSFTEPVPGTVEPTPGSPYAAAKWAATFGLESHHFAGKRTASDGRMVQGRGKRSDKPKYRR